MSKDEQSQAEKYLKESKKEIARIKRFIREAEKRGYVFSDNAIPSLPKKATAATVRKYKAIVPKTLYKKAAYYDQGKKVKGSTRRAQERSEAAKKSAHTRKINRAMKILKEVRRIISEWSANPAWSDHLASLKEQDKNQLETILNGAIASEGEEAVAQRMQEHADEIIELTYAIIYGDSPKNKSGGGRSGVLSNLAAFSAIVRGRPLTVGESMEASEYGEQLDYEDRLE